MWTYHEIMDQLSDLNSKHGNLMTLETAQDAYGLEDLECSSERCKTPVVTLTNKSNPDTVIIYKQTKPHVFISGGVHGNERIG